MVALDAFEFSPAYSVSINPAAISAFLVLLMLPSDNYFMRREMLVSIFASAIILAGISMFLSDSQGIFRGLVLGIILGAALSSAKSIITAASAAIILADGLKALFEFLVSGYASVEIGLAASFDALIFGIAIASAITFIKLSLKKTAKNM